MANGGLLVTKVSDFKCILKAIGLKHIFDPEPCGSAHLPGSEKMPLVVITWDESNSI